MEVQSPAQSLSPFFSIWVKPRETIRNIVDTNPTKYVTLLVMLAGIGQSLDRATSRHLGDSFPLVVILVACCILGPVGGIISLYISGALFRWTGSWLGGQASAEEVRAAIAWSSVPTIFGMLRWIPGLLIIGEELFTSSTPIIEANPRLALLMLGLLVIENGLEFWSFVVLIKSLGEVHRFSAWKALGAILLGALVILVPILCIVGLIVGLSAL